MELYATLRSSSLPKCQSTNSMSKVHVTILTNEALNSPSVTKRREQKLKASRDAGKKLNNRKVSNIIKSCQVGCDGVCYRAFVIWSREASIKCHFSARHEQCNQEVKLQFKLIKELSNKWFVVPDTSDAQQFLAPPTLFNSLRPLTFFWPSYVLFCGLSLAKANRPTSASAGGLKKEKESASVCDFLSPVFRYNKEMRCAIGTKPR